MSPKLASLLSGATICCTGMEDGLRETVQRKTEALGGRYSEHLTEDCSHLVAGCVVKSKKYRLAMRLGIPAVQPAWIEECWQAAHIASGPINEQRKLLQQVAVKKYAVNVLMGCRISVTGGSIEERGDICAMVQALGGVYSPDLSPLCTHLVYEAESSMLLSVKVQFAVKWGIPVVTKQWIYACHARRMLVEEDDFVVSVNEASLEHDAMEQLPIRLEDITEDTPPFLAGCHIYLGEGISERRLAVLRRLILAAGGARHADIHTSLLTHIIIHNQLLPSSLNTVMNGGRARLVHDQWLFDCFQVGRRLLEGGYEVAYSENDAPSLGNAGASGGTGVGHRWKSAIRGTATETGNGSGANPLNILSSSFLNANSSSSGNTSMIHNNTSTSHNNAVPDEFISRTPRVQRDCELATGPFAGRRFCLLLPGPQTRRLGSKTRRMGGIVCESEAGAEWCIVPVLMSTVEHCALTARRDPDTICTDVWLETCLDVGRLLPSTTSYSRPLLAVTLPIPTLASATISQSGFSGPEREFYARVIRLTGARYTDNLSRANSHLLIEAPRTGTKFDFAEKWRIACVSVAWLRDALQGVASEMGLTAASQGVASETNSTAASQERTAAKRQHGPGALRLSFSQPVAVEKRVSDDSWLSQPQLQSQSSHETEMPLLMRGLVFSISQRLWHRREELALLVEQLGGVFLWTFDRNCTHYLHQGNQPEETFREFKQARDWDKRIVSPLWLVHSRDAGRRLCEKDYPHTRKPDGGTDSGLNEQSVASSDVPVAAVPAGESLDWNAIVAEKASRERQLRPRGKIDFSSHPAFATSRVTWEPTETADATHSSVFTLVFSGFTPQERQELIRIVGASQTAVFRVPSQDEETGNAVPVSWHPAATVLICNRPSVSEKFLSACAAGCWVLRREFVTERLAVTGAGVRTRAEQMDIVDSHAEGHADIARVTAESIDWQSVFARYEINAPWNAETNESAMAGAPRIWRMRVARGEGGPFGGWRCVLSIDPVRTQLFQNVLRLGGAQVLATDTHEWEDLPNKSDVTHLFYSSGRPVPREMHEVVPVERMHPYRLIADTIFGIRLQQQ